MARILVIDDEYELRSMLRQMLEHAGHEVSEAVNGAVGIEIYERDAPDLIITDIIMPEKEGVETIIALRRADPALPIIAISGVPVGHRRRPVLSGVPRRRAQHQCHPHRRGGVGVRSGERDRHVRDRAGAGRALAAGHGRSGGCPPTSSLTPARPLYG